MRIYRGSVGVEMSLWEMCDILENEDKMDDLLNFLQDMEMDHMSQFDEEKIKAFEETLLREISEKQRKEQETTETIRMERILDHLNRYGKR
jgi:hypothetical protein